MQFKTSLFALTALVIGAAMPGTSAQGVNRQLTLKLNGGDECLLTAFTMVGQPGVGVACHHSFAFYKNGVGKIFEAANDAAMYIHLPARMGDAVADFMNQSNTPGEYSIAIPSDGPRYRLGKFK